MKPQKVMARSHQANGQKSARVSTNPALVLQDVPPESIESLRARGVVGVTKAQMAAALQVSVRTLCGMMAREEIDYWKIGTRIVRFRVEDAMRRMNETVLVSATARGAK